MAYVPQAKSGHAAGKYGYNMTTLLSRKPVPHVSELAEYTELTGYQERYHDQSFRKPLTGPGRVLFSRSILPLSPIELLAHCASLAFSAAVLWLCGSDTYFKDTNTTNINSILSTFQFVAALHTGIVAASMTAMAVYHLQYELCMASGLPLGYIAFPFQLSSILGLLQPRYRRALLSNTNTTRKKLFGLGILVAVLLQALMNPSSAILIVPQLGWWSTTDPFGSTNGYSWINNTYTSLWPDRLDATQVPTPCNTTGILIGQQCLYASMSQIKQWTANYLGDWAVPNVTITTGTGIVRFLGASPENFHGYSAASTPQHMITGNFGSFWNYATRLRQDLPFTAWDSPRISLLSDPDTPIMRSLVQVQCNPPIDIQRLNDSQYKVDFPANLIKTRSGKIMNNVTATVNITDFKTRHTRIDFKDLTAEAGQPTLGVVASLAFYHPKDLFPGNVSGVHFGLMTCITSSHWIPTNLSTDPNVQNVVIMDHPDPIATLEGSWFKKYARPVEVTLDFAQHINIPVTNSTNNVLEYEMKGTQTFGSYDGAWKWRWPWEVATIVSMQLSDALSRVHPKRSTIVVLCEGCQTGGYLGNPNASNTTTASYLQALDAQNDDANGKVYTNSTPQELARKVESQPQYYTPVRWEILRYGYGWTLSKTISWVGVTVVGLHAILVFAHVTVVMFRQIRFDAWDDLLSLLSLANKSDTVEALNDTGSDLINSEAYARTIKIRGFVGEDGLMDAMLTEADEEDSSRRRQAIRMEPGEFYR